MVGWSLKNLQNNLLDFNTITKHSPSSKHDSLSSISESPASKNIPPPLLPYPAPQTHPARTKRNCNSLKWKMESKKKENLPTFLFPEF